MHDSATFADIDLVGARILGDVELSGSTVTGMLNANRLNVGGGLYLHDGGTFADIGLLGARITGDAVLNGSTVTEELYADRLNVGGSLFLRDGSFKGIRLLGGSIVGDVDLIGSTVTGKVNAARMEVGGALILRDGGAFADISVLGAGVAGDVELSGSTVTGKLAADGLGIGGSLFLRNGGSFVEIDLPGAKIGGIVQLVGSTFGGEVNFTGAAIGVELHLSSGGTERSPTWQNGASLILRNAKADALQARADSWSMSRGDGLLPTDLTGFAFNRLGGLDTSGGASMADESADWLVDWIEAQRDYGDHYDPQPYTQLAQVLETPGATHKSKAIRFAKFEHKREHDESAGAFWLTILGLFVGYGVYPIRALIWFGGLVLLGWALVGFSKQPSVRGFMGLWYSLDNALPLIETNERFRSVQHGRRWLAFFFYLQKLLGFVLATVLVGALTLLSG